MPPKVSIGIRSYNQKEFLKEALESVLTQDYENMEIVVGDDAFTDGTQDMLREYDEKHPGLFKLVLNEKNIGGKANNNVILSACTGKYIALLDGDDSFLPGKLKKQAAFMEANTDCSMCYHNVEEYQSNTGEKANVFGSGPKMIAALEGGP